MRESAETQPGADRRSRAYRIRAIVLRRRNLGESDRILTVFSRELGKHRFVAKGVRRPGSKLAGHSEPFMLSEFFIARTRGLPILTQAQCLRPFPQLRMNERAIAVANVMAERVEMLTGEDQAAPGVYGLVELCLDLLDSESDPEKVQLIFDLLLLKESGFRTDFQRCVECSEPLQAVPNSFIMERGGFTCQNCSRGLPQSLLVPVEVQKIMRMIDRGDIREFLAVRVPANHLARAQLIVEEHISTVTGRESKATMVMRELRLEYSYQQDRVESEDRDGIR